MKCRIQLKDQPTVIFEDNTTCIKHMSTSFKKANRTKHISPHIFNYMQVLVEKGQLDIKK